MENRIRLGIIGASAVRGWANQAHLPGLPYLDEYELRAVCTSKPGVSSGGGCGSHLRKGSCPS